ncbi:MAG: hypothetical protein QW041_02755 [Candidatus Pacearchaeota archaeon]
MAEVNEEIAKAYFEEVCGYFVKTNLYFKKESEKPHKRGGVGASDIDLLLLHPTDGKYGKRAMVSVKGWHEYVLNLKNCKNNYKWMHGFEKQDLKAVENFFGTKEFNKILVVPRVNEKERWIIEQYGKQNKGIDYIISFPFMLNELFNKFKQSSRYYKESEVLQTLAVAYKHSFRPLLKERERLIKKLKKI